MEALIAHNAWAKQATVAIYIPHLKDAAPGRLLRLVGSGYGELVARRPQLEQELDLQERRQQFLHAWWDEPDNPSFTISDAQTGPEERKENGFSGSETLVTVSCLKGIGAAQKYPYLILRISISGKSALDMENKLTRQSFKANLAKAQLAMLNVLSESGFLI